MLLRECLDSIAAQTFEEWECLVVDDGSTDSSVDVASAFGSRDRRFKVFDKGRQRKGAAACRNQGIQKATGRYVMFLDSDDLLSETCVERRVRVFGERSDCDFMVFGTEGFLDSPGDAPRRWNIEKPDPDLLRFLRLDVPWSTTSPIWKRSALLALGGFEQTLPGWQDWQLHVSAILRDLRYCKVNSPADSYHRLSGNDRIGLNAHDIAQVLPKARYVVQLFETHAQRLARDAATRNACVGLLWNLAPLLERNGHLFEALRLWSRLRDASYITNLMWLEGALALASHGRPGGRLAWLRIKRWPASIVDSVDRSTLLVAGRHRSDPL